MSAGAASGTPTTAVATYGAGRSVATANASAAPASAPSASTHQWRARTATMGQAYSAHRWRDSCQAPRSSRRLTPSPVPGTGRDTTWRPSDSSDAPRGVPKVAWRVERHPATAAPTFQVPGNLQDIAPRYLPDTEPLQRDVPPGARHRRCPSARRPHPCLAPRGTPRGGPTVPPALHRGVPKVAWRVERHPTTAAPTFQVPGNLQDIAPRYLPDTEPLQRDVPPGARHRRCPSARRPTRAWHREGHRPPSRKSQRAPRGVPKVAWRVERHPAPVPPS